MTRRWLALTWAVSLLPDRGLRLLHLRRLRSPRCGIARADEKWGWTFWLDASYSKHVRGECRRKTWNWTREDTLGDGR